MLSYVIYVHLGRIQLWLKVASAPQAKIYLKTYTFAQVMACCLTAPSHYLNQCRLLISEVMVHMRAISQRVLKYFFFKIIVLNLLLLLLGASVWNESGGPVQYRISVQNSSQLKSREISLVHNIGVICPIVLQFCTEHGSYTAVLCAKFQNDRTTEECVMCKRDFARFGFSMRLGRILHMAQCPCSIVSSDLPMHRFGRSYPGSSLWVMPLPHRPGQPDKTRVYVPCSWMSSLMINK